MDSFRFRRDISFFLFFFWGKGGGEIQRTKRERPNCYVSTGLSRILEFWVQPRYVHFISEQIISSRQSIVWVQWGNYICDYGVDVDMHRSVYACVITRDFFRSCLYIYMYSTFVKTRDVNESTCDFFFNLSILRVLRYSIVDSKYTCRTVQFPSK